MARAAGYIVHADPRGITSGLVGDLPVEEAVRAVEEGRVRLEVDRPPFSRDVEALLDALDVGSLGELRRLVENGRPDERLGILGRERALVKALARLLHDAARSRHAYGPIRETRRGASFELRLNDDGDEDTGRVVTVTIELDRVEPFPLETP